MVSEILPLILRGLPDLILCSGLYHRIASSIENAITGNRNKAKSKTLKALHQPSTDLKQNSTNISIIEFKSKEVKPKESHKKFN